MTFKLLQNITPLQQQGVDAILNEWQAQGDDDKRKLAYILATVYHETGRRMQPVKEFGGEVYLKAKAYYPYYGRDFVQTTWIRNYEKVKAFTGVDVVSNPELIASVPMAAKVAVHFMIHGLYTGKKLADYFAPDKEDWINARRIINGKDRAETIAGYGQLFYQDLSK